MHIYGVEIHLHSFLTLALDGGEWSDARCGRFANRKEPGYPFNRRLYLVSTLWRSEKSLIPAGIRTADRAARSLITIPTEPSQLHYNQVRVLK